MVVDLNATLLTALELVYEQSRPELRGLWREHVDPYLNIQADTHPEVGDWVGPWLELVVEPVGYLDRRREFHRNGRVPEQPGMLHDRPDARLAAMDRSGVDVLVLHPDSFAGPVGAMKDVDIASGLLAGYNRYLGTYCRPDPARLKGSIQLHGVQPDWSLLEIRRLSRREWVAGASVRLPAGVPIWDSRVTPVLAALEDVDLPLFHRTELFDAPRFPGHADLWDDPLLAETLGAAWDAQRMLTALVSSAVLARHPRLRVCVLDGGAGWVPAWLERLSHISPAVGARARNLLRTGRVVVTIAPHESERAVAAVVHAVGDRCLAWGSGFPRSAEQGPDRLQSWRNLPDRCLEQLLRGNALRVLGDAARTSIRRQKGTAR